MEQPEGHPTIDQIYELLELLDDEEKQLRELGRQRERIDGYMFPALGDAVALLEEFGYGNGSASPTWTVTSSRV